MKKQEEQKQLVDIRDVTVNTALPKNERMNDFLQQIRDPYHFKYDNIAITISFNEEGETFENLIKYCMDADDTL